MEVFVHICYVLLRLDADRVLYYNVIHLRQFLEVTHLHKLAELLKWVRRSNIYYMSGWFVQIGCWLIHVGVKMGSSLACKCSHISVPLCADTNKCLLTYREDQV